MRTLPHSARANLLQNDIEHPIYNQNLTCKTFEFRLFSILLTSPIIIIIIIITFILISLAAMAYIQSDLQVVVVLHNKSFSLCHR